ncbi:hypothetical protein BCh11DRAFT_03914 [Burkholderia sp. Ch1-1]|nr:hypothetical protein BCh11DRAFT_03914 [Burkholderia sp. Ch1-1]
MKKFAILSDGYASPRLRLTGADVEVISVDDVLKRDLSFGADDVLYVPSEDGLNLVAERSGNAAIRNAIRLFKDKFEFRGKVAQLFPDFHYFECPTDEIGTLNLNFEDGRKYVIKPRRGYYATGVREIDHRSNLKALQLEIQAELTERGRYYPDSMLSGSAVIVEEFIGGDIRNSLSLESCELAADLFYDRDGIPQIVGLYHHPHPTRSAYFHTLYYSNAEIVRRYSDKVIEFFTALQSLGLDLRSFPMHAEFKVHRNTLIPIEVNPYRFGGYGLADLMHYVAGINPYRVFFENEHLVADEVWANQHDSYACVVGYNGQDLVTAHHVPDHEAFKAFLAPGLLHYEPLDHTNCPLFGISYLRRRQAETLASILEVDYRQFFSPASVAVNS